MNKFEMGMGSPEQKTPELNNADETMILSFLEVNGIDSFLSRFKIDPIAPIDMAKIYTIDDLAVMVPETDRDKLKNAIRIASKVYNEAKSNPDDVVPEDDDLKYKDITGRDTLSQAQFARIVRMRLNK